MGSATNVPTNGYLCVEVSIKKLKQEIAWEFTLKIMVSYLKEIAE